MQSQQHFIKEQFINKMMELILHGNDKVVTFPNNWLRPGIFHNRSLLQSTGGNYEKCHIKSLLKHCKFQIEEDFIQYIPEFVESELELQRIKHNFGGRSKYGSKFQRVLPRADSSYLNWYSTPSEMDKFMACFEKQYGKHCTST